MKINRIAVMNKIRPTFREGISPDASAAAFCKKSAPESAFPKNCLYLQTQYHTSPAPQPEVRTSGFIQAVTKKAPRRHLS